jgi:NADH-quinone oxidoreductase subunit A
VASEALSYLPMAILGLVAFALVLVTLIGNKTLGPKRGSVNKLTTYECGEKATPGARGPIDVQYYMFVLTFLVFDVEAMFLIPFALKFRELSTGAIVATAMFVGLILVGYVYEIRKKLLTWRTLE